MYYFFNPFILSVLAVWAIIKSLRFYVRHKKMAITPTLTSTNNNLYIEAHKKLNAAITKEQLNSNKLLQEHTTEDSNSNKHIYRSRNVEFFLMSEDTELLIEESNRIIDRIKKKSI